nr:hypothetical protein [Mucilaginibacter sp. L294]
MKNKCCVALVRQPRYMLIRLQALGAWPVSAAIGFKMERVVWLSPNPFLRVYRGGTR